MNDLKSQTNPVVRHNANMREILPGGAVKHKSSKANRWCVKKPQKDRGVSFSMTGPCSGELADVMTLGLQLAKSAKEEGNIDYAQRILRRLKRVPLEYERDRLMRQLAR